MVAYLPIRRPPPLPQELSRRVTMAMRDSHGKSVAVSEREMYAALPLSQIVHPGWPHVFIFPSPSYAAVPLSLVAHPGWPHVFICSLHPDLGPPSTGNQPYSMRGHLTILIVMPSRREHTPHFSPQTPSPNSLPSFPAHPEMRRPAAPHTPPGTEAL